jgi:lysophospholipase L1-like esterase
MKGMVCGDESATKAKRRVLAPLAAAAMMAGALSAEAAVETIRIVALGTSLTARGGWSEPLAAALSRCEGKPVSVTLIALPGATSSWGRRQIERVLAAGPDLVLIEFAVNDAAIHNFVSLAQSRENIRAIIAALRRQQRPPKIHLMRMNPVHGAKAWLRPSLASYEAAHRDMAREQGAGFIDHRAAWSRVSEADRERLIPDGLHPDPREAGEIIVPTLVRSLAGVDCGQEAAPWRH